MDSLSSPASGGGFLASDTLRNIITVNNVKNVVPIISNSFYTDEVLCREQKITTQIPKLAQDIDEELTISEQLTRIWAQSIDYPMSDEHNLARVSQYYQVKKDSSIVAKEDYLGFLNSYLLNINANENQLQNTVRRLKADAQGIRLSEILNQLGYSKLPPMEDPMELLAKVQFPVYVTTGYHDFLERALTEAGRPPKTQLIFWEEGVEYDDLEEQHRQDPLIRPTAAEPVVYHLFGFENYPGSLVISEDDYMKFLVSVVTDTDMQHPIVPQKLREKVSSGHLLLLGYHLRDWDFRVLFRFIMEMRKKRSFETVKTGICIQIPPKNEVTSLVDYLRRYFKPKQFEIEWKRSMDFTRELWQVWESQVSHE
jgi:hypothetical protein